MSVLGACNKTINEIIFIGASGNSPTPPPIYYDTISFTPGIDSSCPSISSSPTPTPTMPVGSTPTPSPTPTVAMTTPTPTTIQTSGTAAVTLTPSVSSVTTGNNMTVMVHVNTPSTQPINTAQINLTFPPSLLKVVSIDDNSNSMTTAFGVGAQETFDNSAGTITIAKGNTTPLTGNLHYTTITFQALSTGTATIALASSSQVLSSVNNTNVLSSTLPSTSIAITSPIQGDFNNDGVVDATDLSILLSAWNTNNQQADINRDGIVNITDLSILLSHWSM